MAFRCSDDSCEVQLQALSHLMKQPFGEHPEMKVGGGLRAKHINKLLLALKKVFKGERPACPY